MVDTNEEIVFDDSEENIDDSVVAEEHAQDSIKKLRGKLKEAEEKAREYLDGWQRAQADFVNLRKRDEEARGEFVKFANVGLIEELLPVLDALSLATSSGEVGVQNTYNLFLSILKRYGLEESSPVGEMFDPKFHESVGVVKIGEKEGDHKILEVRQKGYILSG
ncbi:MAG: nucleotide exchange factor GrpE, partial [bacterium]|nr:nucleotide exchange factor GrpE [bacterium]